MKQSQRISVPNISLPKGGGAIQGIGETFQPNEFSGTASLSIPVQVTPARGLEPQLSLAYSSGAGNGPFGLGFDLSMPSVSRKTSKGIPRYAGTDTFILAGEEDLVPIAERTEGNFNITTYRPRVESAFEKIEQWTDQKTQTSYWQVIDKDNVTSIYGSRNETRIYDPIDPDRIFQWLLAETFDAQGNHVLYEYKAENAENIDQAVYEQNRDRTTNKYIKAIQYGNDRPTTGALTLSESGSEPSWHFEVIFGYQKMTIDPTATASLYNLTTDLETWTSRQDAFSTYQAGFEIRTHRLCHHILMFHRFEDEFRTESPILVSAVECYYDETPTLTRLTEVVQTGYSYLPETQAYTTKSLPPLTFAYTAFSPEGHHFEPLQVEDSYPLPGLNRNPDYTLIDLFGEGIPGVFYNDGQTNLYWEPDGQGQELHQPERNAHYEPPQRLNTFPETEHFAEAGTHLMDLTGNGQLDLVVDTPSGLGYYEAQPDHSWQNFQPFPTVPNEFYHPDRHLVDITGNGLTDVLLIDTHQARLYPSLGAAGFAAPISQPHQLDLPISSSGSATEMISFVDMFGTGGQQLVRIRNGSVECWPSLGYGKFGQKVVLGNAPQFGAGFDTTRLFLADLDGSGTADLIYLSPDRADIYFNQSGNSFSEQPLTVSLPRAYDNLDQISLADVFGNGTNCLIFSEYHPTPRHWVYDFCLGQKPHLLHQIDNNMGAQTEITYSNSVKFYLADKQQGRPWTTRLPFPVQVVAQVKHIDQIAETTMVSSYSYHHGFYDGVEREFRGFGRVERTDAPTFADFAPPAVDSPHDAAYHAPPLLTKTWYHTGAWLKEEDLLAQYENEYWQQNNLSQTRFQYLTNQPDGDDRREAHRALHGTVLRTEVFGRDGTPWQNDPYTVSENQFAVKQLQQKGTHKYGIYFSYVRETVNYDYERNPADPRISHDLTLEIDDYGYVRQSCHVNHSRQADQALPQPAQTTEQQTTVQAIYAKADYIHTVTPFYLLGVPQASQQVELKLTEEADESITDKIINLPQRVEDALKAISASPELRQAQLLHWERDYYYDAAAQKELPLGHVTPEHLHCRTEEVVFDKSQTEKDFTDILGEADLQILLTHGDEHAVGGYICPNEGTDPDGQTASAYYWHPGNFQAYHGVSDFYLPDYECDPFQYPHVNHTVDQPDPPLKTTVEYDKYHLAVIQITDHLDNTVHAEIDYQTLKPTRMTDINGNQTEVLLDPLGMVIATAAYGTEGGQLVGFAPLADYQEQPVPTVEAIWQNPETYLQKAATHFYYDIYAWVGHVSPEKLQAAGFDDADALYQDLMAKGYVGPTGCIKPQFRALPSVAAFNLAADDQKQPVFDWLQAQGGQPTHDVSLVAETYAKGADAFPLEHASPQQTGTSSIQVHLTYFDGAGRTLQAKVKVLEEGSAYHDSGNGTYTVQDAVSPRWLTSGTVRYDDKEHPIQKFEPYFVDSPTYTPHTVGVSALLFYDALGREVLVKTPRNETTQPQAALVYTFSKTLLGELDSSQDPLTFPADAPYLNRQLYGNLKQCFVPSAWSQLHYDDNNTLADSSYYQAVKADASFVHPLPPTEKESLTKAVAFNNYASQEIFDNMGRVVQTTQLKADTKTVETVSGSSTYVKLDILGDHLVAGDDRADARFQMTYNLAKAAVKTEDIDAGTHWVLSDVVGNPIYSRDARGTVVKHRYDELHRPTYMHVSNQTDDSGSPLYGLNQVVERTVYGDSLIDGHPLLDQEFGEQTASQLWNARGKPILHFDQSGLSVSSFYTIQGLPLATGKVLIPLSADNGLPQEVNWNDVEAICQPMAQSLLPLIPNAFNDFSINTFHISNLETHVYTVQARYDALGRVIGEEDPDKNLLEPSYNSLGLAEVIQTTAGSQVPNGSAHTPSVESITYNAKGQREEIEYGNGVITSYSYDPYTYQLRRIQTTRPSASDLQDLTYTYDAVGNITHLTDQVMPTVFYQGEVKPDADYTYDSLYRLITATGREQVAMGANNQKNQNRQNDGLLNTLGSELTNPQALQRYTQTFTYDDSGNLTTMQHRVGGAETGNTRHITIADNGSNQIKASRVGNDATHPTHTYDENGNQTSWSSGQPLRWDYRNNLQAVMLIDRSVQNKPADFEYYHYDSSGQRTRKVHQALAGEDTVLNLTETIYLGSFEIRRKLQKSATDTSNDNITTEEAWHWHQLTDGDHNFCTWRYRITGDTHGASRNQLRYQLTNHLGSSTLEVMDIDGQPKIITYEEYYPYGGTALIAARGDSKLAKIEVKTKTYCYSGKELDNTTGLYYYGLRYYAPWLGRWLKPDPAGTVDGLNLYAFVAGNPVTHVDVGGMTKKKSTSSTKGKGKAGKKTVAMKAPKNYSQKTDPTLFPYIPKGGEIIGEQAVILQLKKVNPSSAHVRVKARKLSNTTMGQGLHEFIPTSERAKIALIKNAIMRDTVAQAQSGARSTPALQPMVNPAGGVAAHTGTFVSPSKPNASQHTKGQGPAHDELRKALSATMAKGIPEVVVPDILNAQIDGTPTGPAILADAPNLVGVTPNLTDVASIPAFAEEVHERREKMKDRTRTIVGNLHPNLRKHTRSPSPERKSLKDGGGYSGTHRSRSPEPKFTGNYRVAEQAAWASQSMRLS